VQVNLESAFVSFIYFILIFKRNAVKVVVNNYDAKDALSMVITKYKTASVAPVSVSYIVEHIKIKWNASGIAIS